MPTTSPNTALEDALFDIVTRDDSIPDAHALFVAFLIDRIISTTVMSIDLIRLCTSQDTIEQAKLYADKVGLFLCSVGTDIPMLCDPVAELVARINWLAKSHDDSYGVYIDAVSSCFSDRFSYELALTMMARDDEIRYELRDVDSVRRWWNMNRFVACYVKHAALLGYLNDGSYFDVDRAITALSRFENEFEDAEGPTINVNANVPAAAVWIMNAGLVIYRACISCGFLDGSGGRTLIWRGSLSHADRWNVWKQRFDEVEGLESATPTTKVMARAASSEMSAILGVQSP